MNRLMITVVSLLIAAPVMAMELNKQKTALSISKKENKSFIDSISNTILAIDTNNRISSQNSILCILNKIAKDVESSDNHVLSMIKIQKLEDRINGYKNDDNADPILQFMLNEIQDKPNSIKEKKAKSFVITYRITRASLILKKLRPQYYPISRWSNFDEMVDFVLMNTKYPLDEEAIKDFVAMLLYQMIFAQQID